MSDIDEAYGKLREGLHITGYAFERACPTLIWLLQEGRWKKCGKGFSDVNAFLASIRIEDFKLVAEQRKKIGALIKELQPKASNRTIAKALNTDRRTIDRDQVGHLPHPAAKKANKSNDGGGANAPLRAPISGAQAAKIVERRTNDVARTQDRRAERERVLGAKITALPTKKFGVIVADPEWHDDVYSEETGYSRHASLHYTTSDTESIKARRVADIAAEDCVLFLWSTNQHLDDAIDVLRAWGFEYASQYIWRKPSPGLGYWNRSVHEVLLIGTRGNIPCPAPGTQKESVIDAPRGEHSEKPEVFMQMIEDYFPTLPKIELNARKARKGWSCWGNEAPQEAAE